MSRASTNVDDPDALRAFRMAMGLGFPGSPHVHTKSSEDSESTTITDFSVGEREQDSPLSYRNTTESSKSKLKFVQGKMNKREESSSKRALGQDSSAAGKTSTVFHDGEKAFIRSPSSSEGHEVIRGHKVPAKIHDGASIHEVSIHLVAFDTSCFQDEVEAVTSSNGVVADKAQNVDLIMKPLSHETEALLTPLQPDLTTPSRNLVRSNVSKLAFGSPDGGLNAPQNSPAIAPALPSPTIQPPKDVFTQEEAHDCVIDIVKELTALSERVQARKIAATNNLSSSVPRYQSSPLTTLVSRSNEIQTTSQSKPVKFESARLELAPDTLPNMTSAETLGSKQSSIPPHLRAPKKRDEVVPEAPSSMKGLLPPHLRGLKQKKDMSLATEMPIQDSSALDSKGYSKSNNENKQPVLQDSPATNSHSKASLHMGSDQDSPKPFTEGSSVMNPSNERNEESRPIVLSESAVSPYTTALEDEDIGLATDSASVSFSKPIEIKKLVLKDDTPILKTSLASSFLDKWGSKRKPLFPRTSNTADKEPVNLENELTFKAWPGQTARYGPSAQIRTCHLKALPSSSSPASVCSIVFGGTLERVQVHQNPDSATTTATVRFLSGDACQSFYDATANGLPLKSRPGARETVVWVTLGKDVDIVGGLLAQQVEQGVTRCVRAVPVDEHLEAVNLHGLATEKGRLLEGFEDGVTQNGSRFIVWRFCDIAHAVAFRGVLARQEDFESCNVSFSEDPCALREVPDL